MDAGSTERSDNEGIDATLKIGKRGASKNATIWDGEGLGAVNAIIQRLK
jgi:hypothetical protein